MPFVPDEEIQAQPAGFVPDEPESQGPTLRAAPEPSMFQRLRRSAVAEKLLGPGDLANAYRQTPDYGALGTPLRAASRLTPLGLALDPALRRVTPEEIEAESRAKQIASGLIQPEEGEAPPDTSAVGALLRGAGVSVAPGVGAAAGAKAGFSIPGGPKKKLVGAILGGMAGSMAANTAQREVAGAVAPEALKELEQSEATDAAQNPLASAGGRLIGSAATFQLNPMVPIRAAAALPAVVRGGATAAQKEALALGAGATGLGAATAAGMPLMEGRLPTKGEIAEGAVQALLFGQPRAKSLRIGPQRAGTPLPEKVEPVKPGETQQYVDTASMDTGISVRDATAEELPRFRAPDGSERMATITPDGGMIVNRPIFDRWVSLFPESKRPALVKSLIEHEWLHTFVSDSEALAFFKDATEIEQALSDRVYFGKNWKTLRENMSPVQRGWEMIRFAQSRLAEVTPQEVVQSKGMEWLTVKSALALLNISQKARRGIGRTEAAKRQGAQLDKVDANLRAFLESRGVKAPVSEPEVAEQAELIPAPAPKPAPAPAPTPAAPPAPKATGKPYQLNTELGFTPRPKTPPPVEAAPAAEPFRPPTFDEFIASKQITQEQFQKLSAKEAFALESEFEALQGIPPEPPAVEGETPFARAPRGDVPESLAEKDAPGIIDSVSKLSADEFRALFKHGGREGQTWLSDALGETAATPEAVALYEREIESLRAKIQANKDATAAAPKEQKMAILKERQPLTERVQFFEEILNAAPKAETPFARAPKKPSPQDQPEFTLPPMQPGETRPTAVEAGATPARQLTPETMRASIDEHLNAASRPSFTEFLADQQRDFPSLSKSQLRDAWIDGVWSKLENASGAELKRLRSALNLKKILRLRRGEEGAPVDILDVPDAPERTTGDFFKKTMTEPQKAAIRRRATVQAEIGMKLIAEAESGRRALTRQEITPEDIAHEKMNAWRSIMPSESANTDALGKIITEGAAVDRTTSMRKVVDGKLVKVNMKAPPPTVTRRVVALLDNMTGRVELVSAYRDPASGPMIADPSLVSLGRDRPNVRLAQLMARKNAAGQPRFTAFRTMLLDEPVRNFHQRFKNMDDFRDAIAREATAKAENLAESQSEAAALVSESDEPERPALRTGGPIIDTDAAAIGHAAMKSILAEDGSFLERAALNGMIDDLSERAKSGKLTAGDWKVITALEKAVINIERAFPDRKGAAVEMALDRIYEATAIEQSREALNASILKQFGGRAKGEEPVYTPSQAALRREAASRKLLAEAIRTGEIANTEAAKDAWLAERATLNAPERIAAGEEFTPSSRARGALPPTEATRIESPSVPSPETQALAKVRGERTAAETRAAQEKLGLNAWLESKQPLNAPKAPETPFAINPLREARNVGRGLYRAARDAVRGGARLYSEWLPERIERAGGPLVRPFVRRVNEIVSREKELYGSLTDSLDPARKEAGKAGAATRWAHGLDRITSRTAVRNAVGAVEGTTPVPAFARNLITLAQRSNMEIGRMLQAVVQGFIASGKWQRNLTAFGYDVIRRGGGRVWNDWVTGLAVANGTTPANVRAFFRRWKAILDDPTSDSAAVERINQDFARQFPRVVTDVRVGDVLGGRWESVVHGDLFNYLENAARRATHVRAFREAFPNTPVGRQSLRQAVAGVRSQLEPQYHSDLDALLRGLQGHPTDSYANLSFLSPDQPVGATFRLVNNTMGNLMARMVLTGQMIVQPGETLAGSAPVFLGADRYARGLARLRQLYPELERAGARNAVMYDWSFDPASPVRSLFRNTGNVLSKAFAQQFLNEVQEGASAAAARIASEDIASGNLSDWDRRMLPRTFQAMGFSRGEAQRMMAGTAPDLLRQFERKAAAFLSSGNKAIAEGSAIGGNRLFNSLFRFQSYPMMKMNQLRKVLGQFGEAWGRGGTAQDRVDASRMLGRFMFGTAMQGAFTVALTSLFYEGLRGEGLGVRMEEAKDEPFQFLVESSLSAMSGPLYLVWRGASGAGLKGMGEQATRLLFPYTMVRDLQDAATGKGTYSDLDGFDRIGKFVQQKMPGTKAIASGLSLFGLSEDNRKLDAAIKGYYRWRRQELGFTEREAFIRDDERVEFRTQMKKAVEALKVGNFDAYAEALSAAAQAPGVKDAKSIGASLRGRKILRTPTGADLSFEQMEALRKRIGDEAVDRLIHFDAMIDAVAR